MECRVETIFIYPSLTGYHQPHLPSTQSPFFSNLVPPSNYLLILQHTLQSCVIFLFPFFSWLHILASHSKTQAKDFFFTLFDSLRCFLLVIQNTLSRSTSKPNDFASATIVLCFLALLLVISTFNQSFLYLRV